jgi:hypothetical protein
MKFTNKAAILLLTLCMTGASQVVLADDNCSYAFGAVDQAIMDAEFFSGRPGWESRDEGNMLLKVQKAIAKVSAGKYSDAIEKLGDISEKANALADPDSGKKKLEDASGINDAIYAAAVCINTLGK